MRVSKLTYPVFLLAIRYHLKSFRDACILPGGKLVSRADKGDKDNYLTGYNESDIYVDSVLDFSLIRDLVALAGHDGDSAGNVLGIIAQCLTTVEASQGSVQALDIRKLYNSLVKDNDTVTVPCHDDLQKNAPGIILPDVFSEVVCAEISRMRQMKPDIKPSAYINLNLHSVLSDIKSYASVGFFYEDYLNNKDAVLAEIWFDTISEYRLRMSVVYQSL